MLITCINLLHRTQGGHRGHYGAHGNIWLLLRWLQALQHLLRDDGLHGRHHALLKVVRHQDHLIAGHFGKERALAEHRLFLGLSLPRNHEVGLKHISMQVSCTESHASDGELYKTALLIIRMEVKNLLYRDCSKRVHTCIQTIWNVRYTQFKMGSKQTWDGWRQQHGVENMTDFW